MASVKIKIGSHPKSKNTSNATPKQLASLVRDLPQDAFQIYGVTTDKTPVATQLAGNIPTVVDDEPGEKRVSSTGVLLQTLALTKFDNGTKLYWFGDASDYLSADETPEKRIRVKDPAQSVRTKTSEGAALKSRYLLHAVVRVRYFCTQQLRKQDIEWILRVCKDLLSDLGGDAGARKLISEFSTKIRTHASESTQKYLTRYKNKFADIPTTMKSLYDEDVVFILGTAYANSVWLNGSAWAKKLAAWHLVGSKGHTTTTAGGEKSRRKAAKSFIQKQVRKIATPNPMDVPLMHKFAGSARPTKAANDVLQTGFQF